MTSNKDVMLRGTGVLIIEVVHSNPNGDPDRESDPRTRPDEHGEISPVSVKRKVRDLIADKTGYLWEDIRERLDLEVARFDILEQRGRKREAIVKEIREGTFEAKYWDARVFGNTFLEEGLEGHIRCGAVQFGVGISVAPVAIERMTTTNKSGVEEDKDRGMAPLGFRAVEHGVYVMPFYVNASAAKKSGCTKEDIAVLQAVLPYTYSQTSSYIRNSVELRHAWYVEHKSPLGSVADFSIVDALRPKKVVNPERPSQRWEDYDIPAALPDAITNKVHRLRDLVAEAYAPVSS